MNGINGNNEKADEGNEVKGGNVGDKTPGKEKGANANANANASLHHSAQIMKAFFPIRILLLIFGRSPFQIVKKKNGSYVYRYRKLSPHSIYFHFTSVLFGVIFVMLVIGYGTQLFEIKVSEIKNRCQETWESFIIKRTAVPTALTVSWLYLTLSGSTLLIFKGKQYIHYLNYWNRATTVLDMDPTEGTYRAGIVDTVHCVFLIFLFMVCYASKYIPSLHEGAASVTNALVRLFIQDIGVNDKFSQTVNNDAKCSNRVKGKVYTPLDSDFDTVAHTMWRLLGFFIQMYAIYGSLCFIIQFRFYCRMLRNIANIWNERFKNSLHGVEEDPKDQTKRRLSLKLIMKDHLIVVQMFKLTESAFSSILQSFYTVQIINLCCELYFLSAMKGSSSCDTLLLELGSKEKEIMKACLGINATENIDDLLYTKKSTVKFFSDPCSPAQFKLLQEAIVALSLLAQTLRITFSTTMEAAMSMEEAMRGFNILRRHCYMYCKNRRERNFTHSLIFSFARNNPIQITAGGYFVVNRSLIAIISGSIFTYYIILLQFKPGEFDTKDYCIDKVCKNIPTYQPPYNLEECNHVYLPPNNTAS